MTTINTVLILIAVLFIGGLSYAAHRSKKPDNHGDEQPAKKQRPF
jgi:hypothetical protein